jgi:rhodanese-related sulfurtransferase
MACDLGVFVALVFTALLLGVAVDHVRAKPLPLFSSLEMDVSEKGRSLTPPEVSLGTVEFELDQKAFHIIDVRPELFFAQGHIRGAINAPWGDWGNPLAIPANVLSFSRLDPVVVYCSDFSCPAAKMAAKILLAHGYSRVTVFSGGWYVWKRQAKPSEQAP